MQIGEKKKKRVEAPNSGDAFNSIGTEEKNNES